MMDDEMERLWKNLKLTEDEMEQIGVQKEETQKASDLVEYCIMGKLNTEKNFNRDAFKKTMSAVWKPKDQLRITDLGGNLFLFYFKNLEDRKRVMEEGPWCFDRFLLILKEVDGDKQPSTMKLYEESFWIQIYDLPLRCMTREVGEIIGNKIGKFVGIDDGKREVAWGSYLRIRLRLDTTKPLKRGVMIRLENEVFWIPIKYEKLPRFCNLCGIIGHLEKECKVASSSEKESNEERQYGAWLNAPSRRVREEFVFEGVKSKEDSTSRKQHENRTTMMKTTTKPIEEEEGVGPNFNLKVSDFLSLHNKKSQSLVASQQTEDTNTLKIIDDNITHSRDGRANVQGQSVAEKEGMNKRGKMEQRERNKKRSTDGHEKGLKIKTIEHSSGNNDHMEVEGIHLGKRKSMSSDTECVMGSKEPSAKRGKGDNGTEPEKAVQMDLGDPHRLNK